MQLNTDSKIISTALLLVFTVAFTAAFNGQQAQAAGFGSRKKPVAQATPEVVEQSVPQPVAPSQAPSQVAQTPQTVPTLSEPQFQAPVAIQAPRTRVSRKTLTPEPPSADNVEWIRVPFDKAENEVLMLFQRDLAKLEDQTSELAIYEVRTSGRLPKDYQAEFKNKLERIILSSKSLRLKECRGCEQARLVKTESGEVRYESYSLDPKRPAKIAAETGVDSFLVVELKYTQEDLGLHVKLFQPSTGEVQWVKEYSTADVVKTREGLADGTGYRDLNDNFSGGDALSRLLIGEIAFSTILSMGVSNLPTVTNKGGSSSLIMYPTVDLLLGERYDRGRKRFGFLIGGSFNPGISAENGTPLPFLIRIAPQFRYSFNPYNVTTARYSVSGELGAAISSGLTTGYISVGPEVTLINRFSVSLLPAYFMKATQGGPTNTAVDGDGKAISKNSADIGTFGGLGVMTKVNINW